MWCSYEGHLTCAFCAVVVVYDIVLLTDAESMGAGVETSP